MQENKIELMTVKKAIYENLRYKRKNKIKIYSIDKNSHYDLLYKGTISNVIGKEIWIDWELLSMNYRVSDYAYIIICKKGKNENYM